MRELVTIISFLMRFEPASAVKDIYYLFPVVSTGNFLPLLFIKY